METCCGNCKGWRHGVATARDVDMLWLNDGKILWLSDNGYMLWLDGGDFLIAEG